MAFLTFLDFGKIVVSDKILPHSPPPPKKKMLKIILNVVMLHIKLT